MIIIKKYQNNKNILVEFMEKLQDYLIQIDPLKRLRRLPKYGDFYVNNLLQKIEQNDGIIYIAEFEKKPVGIIAGIFEKQTKDDILECIPSKSARILELIVDEEYRGKNIGSLLMDKIEKYFQNKGCDIVRVEVFEPNINTHNFYYKKGYQDRAIDMVKNI